MAETSAIWSYVDRQNIAGSFDNSRLSPEEVDAAAGAIQVTRAQFVVDSIAVELDQRREVLLMDREEAVRQLARIDAQLAQFDPNAVPPVQKGDALLDSGPERYRKLLGANMNQRDLYKALENEPPFMLWLSKKLIFSELSPPYSLKEWIHLHMGDIKEIYGDKSMVFTRAANSLSWYLRHNTKALQEEGLISSITTDEAGNERLVIDNPNEFMKRALCATNFGVKSAIATLAIADMQRQEHTAADTQ